jgi:hypothetical protein
MGQEYGHAYEDLLELALLQILPSLCQDTRFFRISPTRRMRGVTFDIDHLVEISQDGDAWTPFTLFMEKHSDSMDNSHLHFRRHLEEYVQAKVSSVQNFGFSTLSSVNVVNLIYGKEDGWKQTVISESKRLIWPTLYLVEEPYHEEISQLVADAVAQCQPPYRREIIQRNLYSQSRNSEAFSAFQKTIREYLLVDQESAPAAQREWIQNEITRALEYSSSPQEAPDYAYIRRTLTEFFILNPEERAYIIRAFETSSVSELSSNRGIESRVFRCFQLAFVRSSINLSLIGYQFIPSEIMQAFPRGDWLSNQLEHIEQVFFDNSNPFQISSADYLAYFDIRNEVFIEIAEAACHCTRDLIQGDSQPMIDFLMQPCVVCSLAVSASERPQDRTQNLHLESVMALASCMAKVLTNARIDLSTSTLARHARISESRINIARSATITQVEIAQGLVEGVSAFYRSLEIEDVSTVISAIDQEIVRFHEWQNWSFEQNLGSPPQMPNVLNPSITMSLGWFRHNQLNSHSIFNPLSAIVWNWAQETVGAEYQSFGFPRNRSANPLQIVLGDTYEGADYEFSVVFWNPKQRSLKIFETSSVVNFKNTSHKCKEFSAKIRAVKALLSEHCDAHFWLLVDGDWRREHMRDLLIAGWDEVVYSRDFIANYV